MSTISTPSTRTAHITVVEAILVGKLAPWVLEFLKASGATEKFGEYYLSVDGRSKYWTSYTTCQGFIQTIVDPKERQILDRCLSYIIYRLVGEDFLGEQIL